ncbi:hypothetical protein [Serinicoccus sediminis]|uniref:hypothetical protein n=1 Tax=Serinicoccus sediminis TaxID=2306021 RepID=UPI0010205B2B|nr:hypothetical protein [Serinicoccus sediminis]
MTGFTAATRRRRARRNRWRDLTASTVMPLLPAKVAVELPVTSENHLHCTPMTPDELRAADDARLARADEVRRAHALWSSNALWSSVAGRSDVLGKVAALHSPDPGRRSWLYCTGCDAGSYAEDSPEWPCRTALLIAAEFDLDLQVLVTHGEWPPETTDTEGATS